MGVSAALHVLKTSGGREIVISVYMFLLVCARITFMTVYVGECKHLDFFVYERVHMHVCACVCVQSNPDYTHFSVSHFRRMEGRGRGRKRGRERRGKRDVLPPRQTPFK